MIESRTTADLGLRARVPRGLCARDADEDGADRLEHCISECAVRSRGGCECEWEIYRDGVLADGHYGVGRMDAPARGGGGPGDFADRDADQD